MAGQHAGLGARRYVTLQQRDPAADQPMAQRHAEMANATRRVP